MKRLALLAAAGCVAFAGLSIYLVPLFAALYGWLFVGEALRSFHLAGMLLVLCGVWLAGRSPRPVA